MRKFIEEKFWLLLIIALVLGLVSPFLGKDLSFLIIPSLMVILFLTYLKIDYLDILSHVKQPKFIAYVLCIYLLLIPAVLYAVVSFMHPSLAISVLLLCSMPPGAAAPFLTDLMKGNTTLSIAVTFLSYIIAPFTVVALFFFLTQKTIQLDLWGLAQTLLLINFLPLIFSQIVRKYKKGLIKRTQTYFSVTNIVLITLMVYIIIASQSQQILSQPLSSLISDTFWLFFIFTIHLIAGYYLAFWRKKDEKIALAVSKAYMNNALAIGLAFSFFEPRVIILMVLSEIPWNTTLGPFRYLLLKLK